MFEVETSAHGVPLDDLITHGDKLFHEALELKAGKTNY